MPTYWLKAIGTGTENVPNEWQGLAGGLLVENITYARTWRCVPGDFVAYYAVGWQKVVAVGKIIGPQEANPIPDDLEHMRRVNLDWTAPKADQGIPRDAIDPEKRLRNAMMRRSHIRLRQSEVDALFALVFPK